MKKVLFGMAFTVAAIALNAQEFRTADGKTATPTAATNVSREQLKTEQGEELRMRITRVLGLDAEMSAKVAEITNDYYTKLATTKNADALKAEREAKLKRVLGDEKYNNLNDYRAKLKANPEATQTASRRSVDRILLD